MNKILSKILTKLNFLWLRSPEILIVCLVLSLVFDVKLPISEHFSYYLGEKKDFTIAFLHLSDLILLVLILTTTWLHIYRSPRLTQAFLNSKIQKICIALFLTLLFLSWILNLSKLTIPYLSIYYLLLITKFIVLHGTIRAIRTSDRAKEWIYNSLIFCLLICSALSIYQFSNQGELGLSRIGESRISPYLSGVAKIEGFGQVFVRTYATFPHPNVYAAFLVIALLLSYYLLFKANIRFRRSSCLLYFTAMELLSTALMLTFSRAAWLAAGLCLATFTIFTWNKLETEAKKNLFFYISGFIASLLIFASILLPLIRHRGNIFDKAYSERRSYNLASLNMIRFYPIFGIGPAESIVEMPKFMGNNSLPNEIQPIHNYYLILAAEYGIPALILFIFYFMLLIKQAVKNEKNQLSLGLGLGAILAFAVLMLFDHYFYTIQQSVGLFWLFSALLL